MMTNLTSQKIVILMLPRYSWILARRVRGVIDRLHSMFSGSPDYIFEAISTIFPEQYPIEGLFNEPTAVLAMADLDDTQDSRLHKYFLIHADTPRRWQRVTVLPEINCNSKHSAFSHLSAPDFLEHSYKTLPADFQSQLEKLFHNRKMLETIKSVSIYITNDDISIEGESYKVTKRVRV